MNASPTSQLSFKPFYIVVICAVLIQLTGHYFANKWLVYESFKGLWPTLRIAIPLLLFAIMAIPYRCLRLGIPKFDKQSLILLLIAIVALSIMTLYLANFADEYLNHYRRGVPIEVLRKRGRFNDFLVFTLSTLVAWEFFHRGFLLGALQNIFAYKLNIEKKVSTHISIVFVAVFEALFHIKKPMVESMPLLFASMALSWLTIRTNSIWPALLIHLSIELIFGYSAYVGW